MVIFFFLTWFYYGCSKQKVIISYDETNQNNFSHFFNLDYKVNNLITIKGVEFDDVFSKKSSNEVYMEFNNSSILQNTDNYVGDIDILDTMKIKLINPSFSDLGIVYFEIIPIEGEISSFYQRLPSKINRRSSIEFDLILRSKRAENTNGKYGKIKIILVYCKYVEEEKCTDTNIKVFEVGFTMRHIKPYIVAPTSIMFNDGSNTTQIAHFSIWNVGKQEAIVDLKCVSVLNTLKLNPSNIQNKKIKGNEQLPVEISFLVNQNSHIILPSKNFDNFIKISIKKDLVGYIIINERSLNIQQHIISILINK
ncbi:MAG: hypothetical protein QXM07_09635 [Nitrososphaerota archaeon]